MQVSPEGPSNVLNIAYGVVRFSVATRTREFAVRIALGATPRMVQWMVIRECARDSLIGMMSGLVLAIAAGHVLHFFVWGVDLLDPRVYFGVITTVLAITLLSSYLPTSPLVRIDAGRSLTTE